MEWVTDKLLPVLGRIDLFQPRSVVILDNATTHHSDEVVRLIRSVGADVIFFATVLPILKPNRTIFQYL